MTQSGYVTNMAHHQQKKAARLKQAVEEERKFLEKHENYGNILYEKVNSGRSYEDYYNSTWKLKTGKTLKQYKYNSWQNMRILNAEEATGINDTSTFTKNPPDPKKKDEPSV